MNKDAGYLNAIFTFLFPRLGDLDLLLNSYLEAVSNYRHDPSLERAMRAAEYAQEFNDKRYWWQNPRRVVIWRSPS